MVGKSTAAFPLRRQAGCGFDSQSRDS